MRRKTSTSFFPLFVIHYSFEIFFIQERFNYDSRWLGLHVDGGHDRDGTFCLVLLESRDDFVPERMIRVRDKKSVRVF